MLAAALALLAFAIVNTFSVVHDVAESGHDLPLWEPFVWEVSSILVILALLPGFMALARRFPFTPPWARVVVVHAIALLAFSALHIAAMGFLRWAIYAVVGGYYAPLGPLGDFLYEFRKDALGYAAFVLLYALWRRHLAAVQVEAARPIESIEVRDGARRVFVPLSDVVWIEAAGNYVALHQAAGEVLHRASLAEMERALSDTGFIRIHRSRLVRRSAISQIESKPSGDYVVRLADGRELAGSRRYRQPLLDA